MSPSIFLDKMIFVLPEPLVAYDGQYVKDLIHLPEALSKSPLEKLEKKKIEVGTAEAWAGISSGAGAGTGMEMATGAEIGTELERGESLLEEEEQEQLPFILKKLHDKKCNSWIYLIEKEVASQIQYQFSNKKVVTLIDILFHPYKKYVPELLLPMQTLSSSEEDEQGEISSSFSFSPLYHYTSFHLNSRIFLKRSYSEDFNELNKMIFILIHRWEKISSHEKPSLYLTFEMDPYEKRNALEVKKIDFLFFQKDGPIGIELKKDWPATGEAHIHYQIKKGKDAGKHKLFLQNAFIDKEKRKLSFHDYAHHHHLLLKEEEDFKVAPPSTRKSRRGLLERKKEEEDQRKKQNQNDRSRIQVRGHGELYKRFAKGSFAFPTHWKKENLSCESLQANLDEKGFMHIKTFFQYNGQKFHLDNIGQEASLLLTVFNQGLSTLKKSIQSHPRAASIFRHKGIVHFLFVKYGDLFLKENPTTWTEEESQEKLRSIAKESLGYLEQKYSEKLNDKHIQKEVILCIKRFLDYLYALPKKPLHIYFDNTELSLKNYYSLLLNLLYKIIKIHFEEKSILSSCFVFFEDWHKKIQDNVVVYPDSYREKEPVSFIHSYPLKKELFLRIMQQFSHYPIENIEIHMNGKQVHVLREKDLISEFEIQTKVKIESGKDSQKINWFELHPRVFFHGEEISLDKMKGTRHGNFVEINRRFYILHPKHLIFLKYLKPFWDKTADKSLKKRDKKDFYILPKSQSLEMLALRASGISITGDENWKKICKFYDEMGKERTLKAIPSTVPLKLKNYQHYGVNWIYDLYHLHLGAILADDMGLGKTPQTLCCMEILRLENEMKHCLVVVPTSLSYNWQSEVDKFTPKIPNIIFNSKEKDQVSRFFNENPQGCVIVTYGLLVEYADLFCGHSWNIVVFDEAQNLKTLSARRTGVARKIPANFKLCLTGTPMENHYGEFFSLVDFVLPGALGNYQGFYKKYIHRNRFANTHDVELLKLKTQCIVLRRSKKEILLELPEKTESVIKIPFEERQREIYRSIASIYNSQVLQAFKEYGEGKSQFQALTALLRLRQVCSDPSAVPNIEYPLEPPKISLLVESIESILSSGESILVFTQFIRTFERIQKAFHKKKVPYFYIHGAVHRKQREQVLRKFHDFEKGSVLLMTLKTGGVGLNLTKASFCDSY